MKFRMFWNEYKEVIAALSIITVFLVSFIGPVIYYELKDVCDPGRVKQITSEYVVCSKSYDVFDVDNGYTTKSRHWRVHR